MNRGGKRIGAGRKAVTDKKIAVTVYVKQSVVKKRGKTFIKNLLKNKLC